MQPKKYLVVGGNPIRSYTGTGTFTGLHVVGGCDTEEEVKKLVEDNYDACGGLIAAYDTTTLKDV